MFFIDFTSPEGNTYRIDLSEQPITHICPVCGDQLLFCLDESDPIYTPFSWNYHICASCLSCCTEYARISKRLHFLRIGLLAL